MTGARRFDVAERRRRLGRRHLLATPGRDVDAVTAALVGLHASDPATPYLSLWARLPGFAVADLDDALYRRRSVVKQLAMRRTLWVLPADRHDAVLGAASARVADAETRRLAGDVERAGVAADGGAWVARAVDAVTAHLRAHGPADAAALRAALPELAGHYDPAPDRSWGGAVPLAPRVLIVAGARGTIVRGDNGGPWPVSRPRYVDSAQWLGRVPSPGATRPAMASLMQAWLYGFGPATLADARWWFGSTLTTVRQALDDIGAVSVTMAGEPGFALPDDLDAEPACAPWAALLPGLDPSVMGWADKSWYLGPHRGQVFDGNGNAGPTAWWDGAVVGGWRQDADGRVVVQLLADVGPDGRDALARRAEDLTAWLTGRRIVPRFPTALSRAGHT